MGKNSMNTKWIGLLVCVLFISLVGCTQNGEDDTDKTEQDPLVIYCMESNSNVDYYIRSFKSLYANIDVVKKTFADPTQMDELVVNELLVGEGPDIIIFSDQTGLDVLRMAQNGSFASLDKKMEKDENLSIADYITSAIDAGKIDGKQYILPLTIKIPFIIYNGDDDSNFLPNHVITHRQFMDSLITNIDRFKDNENYGVIAGANPIIPMLISTQVLAISENNKPDNLNDANLKDVVEWIYTYYHEYQSKSRNILSRSGMNNISVAESFMYGYDFSLDLLNNVWAHENYYREAGINRLGISVFNEIGSNNVAAVLGSYGVITNNAHPYAYDFLRIAMDANPMSDDRVLYGLSANIENIRTHINAYMNKPETFYRISPDLAFWVEPMSGDMGDTLNQIFDSINNVVILNPKIVGIFQEAFSPYIYENSKPYDECAADFKQRLNLYLSE